MSACPTLVSMVLRVWTISTASLVYALLAIEEFIVSWTSTTAPPLPVTMVTAWNNKTRTDVIVLLDIPVDVVMLT